MAKCAMTGKNIKCPLCKTPKVSLFYATWGTVIYCQNKHEKCASIFHYAFVAPNHKAPTYPAITGYHPFFGDPGKHRIAFSPSQILGIILREEDPRPKAKGDLTSYLKSEPSRK